LPLRPGDEGEPVRDLQRRLAATGFDTAPDEPGRFGSTTEKAVVEFQTSRGLLGDGIVGPQTWAQLVEAGWRLGDRLLYLRTPHLRGDDVDELQRRLGAIGFDAGRVDGIFGARTAAALHEFQRNAGLTTDGVCGPDTVSELRRLGPRREGDTSTVSGVREREALRTGPRTLHGRRVVVGTAGGLDALCERVHAGLRTAGAVVLTVHHPDGSVQAAEANEFGGDAFVSLDVADEGFAIAYFVDLGGNPSAGGRRLAHLVHEELPALLAEVVPEPRGMRTPVLRETRMVAVVCRLGPPALLVEHGSAVAAAVTRALARWAETPVDG
jgi:N-acetylmuramoyl-L-alanine amidase